MCEISRDILVVKLKNLHLNTSLGLVFSIPVFPSV